MGCCNIKINVKTRPVKLGVSTKLMATGKQAYPSTVELDMVDGDQILEPIEGRVFSKITVKKPNTLVAENIRKDINIGGVVGSFKPYVPVVSSELNVEPKTEIQIFTPGENEYYDKVNINAVTSSIDSNITPTNIRSGVTILGVQGNLEPDKPNQDKQVTPTTSEQVITADLGYELGSVTVSAVNPSDYYKPEEETVVNPTISQQEVLPTDGSVLSKVTVNAVTSEIDSNIAPENIKKNVSILGVTGILESGGSASGEDMLQARVDATNSCKYLMYYYDGDNIDFLVNLDTSNVNNMENMFANCINLTSIDLSSFNTANVKDMTLFVSNCKKLSSIDMSMLNLNNVTNMYGVFYNCSKLTDVNLSGIVANNLTSVNSMFYGCESLKNINFNEFSANSLSNASSMFANCAVLTKVDLSSIGFNNLTNASKMFYSCRNLQEIVGVINLIKITSLSNLRNMFDTCTKLTTFTLKNIKANLTIGSGTSYGTLLTTDTLINTIKELWDYSSGTSTYTLIMSTASKTAIADIYVKLVTPTDEELEADPNLANKKPCVVCESTDDGAMTITAYANSKHWTLA